MLHTLTIKDQPLWNIQSFTADVAACFGVHADRYLEEPNTFFRYFTQTIRNNS